MVKIGAQLHRFGPTLDCLHCGWGWHEHQRNPRTCRKSPGDNVWRLSKRKWIEIEVRVRAGEDPTAVALDYEGVTRRRIVDHMA